MIYKKKMRFKRIFKRNIKRIFTTISWGIEIFLFVFIIQNMQFKNEGTKIGNIDMQRLSSGNSSTGLLYEDSSDTNEENNDKNITNVINNATKSVVGVSKLRDTGSSIFQNNGAEQIGIGSGIIVSKNGYILTNEHVSNGKGSTCYITIEDGKQYKGNVVWSDANLDLSIIKVNMKFLDVAFLGDSNNISVGEMVYAIGNPIGFEFQKTVTSGIISALDRTVVFKENEKDIYLSNLIQTDAVINPGNSGGPLINKKGEVLGVNTVKITSADGIGFAVPINVVKPIIEKFEKDGRFDEAEIGIFAYDKNVIPYLEKMNTSVYFEKGIYVAQISLNSQAYRSGLQIGDVITKIDDVELNKMCELREYIYKKNVKDKVRLYVLRRGRSVEIEVELGRK